MDCLHLMILSVYCYTGSQIDGFIIAKINTSIQFIKSLCYKYQFSALTKHTAVFFILKRKIISQLRYFSVIADNIAFYALKPLVEAFFLLIKLQIWKYFLILYLKTISFLLGDGIWEYHEIFRKLQKIGGPLSKYIKNTTIDDNFFFKKDIFNLT